MSDSILSRARIRLDALKREGDLGANAANVAEAYELIVALAQELAWLQADAHNQGYASDNHGYASPPAGTQTIVFADQHSPSNKAVPPRSVGSSALRLGILEAWNVSEQG